VEKNFESYIQAWKQKKESGKPFVTVTLVNSRGSAPQDQGARMITDGVNVLFGTVGGGKVEAKAIELSRELLNSDGKTRTHHVQWNLQRDVGMTCGGEVSLFFEIENETEDWEITVFGAGHVSQELCRVLERLNCRLTCVDNRSEWLAKLPNSLNKVELVEPKDHVAKLSDNSFAILMTMGHATDAPILAEILKQKSLPYVGVIGSDSKARLLRDEMKKADVPAEKTETFICPIGESFGDNSPAEIALSIAAQLVKVKDQVFKTAKRNKEN
jgi:xanthine dehydrogenase accessory factor